jgi:hypothetical protein
MPDKSTHIDTLVEMASKNCLAVMYYRKGVTRDKLPARLVEPYSFTEGRQDLMIRCYQVQKDQDADDAGWRFFMAHKIDHVEPTRLAFKPRRRVVLPTGVVTEATSHNPHWATDGRRVYRDLVGDALADGTLDEGERYDLEGVRQKYKLTADDVRFVHASVYHRCLGCVIDDGFLTEHEMDQIRFLHRAMRQLGWSIGE